MAAEVVEDSWDAIAGEGVVRIKYEYEITTCEIQRPIERCVSSAVFLQEDPNPRVTTIGTEPISCVVRGSVIDDDNLNVVRL
jgi:hypothetical protein